MIQRLLNIIHEADEVIQYYEFLFQDDKEKAITETVQSLTDIDILLNEHFGKT